MSRVKARLLSVVVLVGVFLISGTAVADPKVEQNKADQKLAEAEATLEGATDEAKEAGKQLAHIEDKLPGAQKDANSARGIAAAARVTANAAEDDADSADAAHSDAADHFATTQDSVSSARDTLGDVATSLYQGEGLVAINAVMQSGDAIEAADRMQWVNEVARRKSNAVDSLIVKRQNASEAENATQVALDDATDARNKADDALADAEDQLAAAESAESDLKDLRDSKADAKDTADSQREQSLSQYDDAKSESDRIAADLRDAQKQDEHSDGGDKRSDPGGSKGSDGKFLMPVDGWKSSEFGNRYDPYYKVWQLHAGTDFAAGGGAPIYAADGGTVNQAGWNGGYGNYTCIYHGGGISTCYGHQSRIGVSVGQHVDRGQRIGDVGTTGASTGTHLHFEVRINGDPVQPLDYLPSCLC